MFKIGYVAFFTIVQAVVLLNTQPNLMTFIGTLAGVLCVTTLVFRNSFTFIFGMISNVLFLLIGLQNGVYSEMIQQPMYFVLSIVGLYTWISGKNSALYSFLSKAKVSNVLIISMFFIIIWGIVSYNLGSQVFIRDAFLGGIALAAQTLEIGKNNYSWVGWVLLNAISISTWVTVGNTAMATMYVLYLMNSLYGLIKWNTNYKFHAYKNTINHN